MNILTACEIIGRVRGDAILIATMGSMVAFDKLGAQQPRLSSVPLMGGAPSLGLGIALAKPQCKVVVVDDSIVRGTTTGKLVKMPGVHASS